MIHLTLMDSDGGCKSKSLRELDSTSINDNNEWMKVRRMAAEPARDGLYRTRPLEYKTESGDEY